MRTDDGRRHRRRGAAAVISLALTLWGASARASQDEWLRQSQILVPGDLVNKDCRTGICKHNENTDMTRWRGSVWLVHRTADSQILGPNSSLRVYRSRNAGRSFALQAIIPADFGRDIRDPSFYQVGRLLYLKAITRLPGFGLRDTGVDSISVETHSRDGKNWSPLRFIGPVRWGFWRVVQHKGVYYSAAYEDGDLQVKLFRSTDGENWTEGAQIYGVSEDTPLETELVFMPSGRMLALVRMDGTDFDLLGFQGRLRTKVCWAEPPYDAFDCPQELNGVRLDGARAFFWKRRLFVVARKHIIGPGIRKRTALYEITGHLDGGPIGIVEWGELPSAGDTAYAGTAGIGRGRFLVSWYSSDIAQADPNWVVGLTAPSDIWLATIDLTRLPRPTPRPIVEPGAGDLAADGSP